MYYARNTLWRRIKCKSIAVPLLNNYMTSSIWKSRTSSSGNHMSCRGCLSMYRPIYQSTVGHIWVATSVECWWWVGQSRVSRYRSTYRQPCRTTVHRGRPVSMIRRRSNDQPSTDCRLMECNNQRSFETRSTARLDQRTLHRYRDRYVNRQSTDMSADTSVGNSTFQKEYKWKIF